MFQQRDRQVYLDRVDKVRAAMAQRGVDAVILSVGHDLPYLTGYLAMPTERLTMLVLPRNGDARLLIPRLEVPRVVEQPGVFDLVPWDETDDPVALAVGFLEGAVTIAVGDQMWSRFLVELLAHLPTTRFTRAVELVAELRMHKDAAEIAALVAAGAAVDRIAAQLQGGEIKLIGRSEAAVSADIAARLLDVGHEEVGFAIVASGQNAASPHHHAGSKIIGRDEIVLFDFGGTLNGYCSDITRCVFTGDVDKAAPDLAEAYDVLHGAHAAAVAAATVGTPCQDVDRAARTVIADAGYGEYFVHRTGHGIGMEGHEDPYIVAGNERPLADGHAFSIEPGIYIPHRWGMRLEDIVVATGYGPLSCNTADHSLISLG